LSQELNARGFLEYVHVDERIILKCILKKCSARIWSDLSQGSVYWKAFVEIKTVDFIKGRTFLYQLRDCPLHNIAV